MDMNLNTTKNFKGDAKPAVKSTPARANVGKGAKTQHEDPWSIMVEFEMPRPPHGESVMMSVHLNDYEAYLPRGKRIKAPKPVYQLCQRKIKAEANHAKTAEEMQGNHQIGER